MTECDTPLPDEEAFVRQLSAHDAGVRAFLQAMVGDPGLVDELAQETSVVLWRRRASYNGARPFGAWARGVARLVVFEDWRRQRRQGQPLSGGALEAVAAAFDRQDDEGTQRAERLAALRACRDQLKPDQQRLLILRYHDELDESSVASRAGAGIHAVHKSLVRIRVRLRACIERRLSGEQP